MAFSLLRYLEPKDVRTQAKDAVSKKFFLPLRDTLSLLADWQRRLGPPAQIAT
jgi:hypothetical protein